MSLKKMTLFFVFLLSISVCEIQGWSWFFGEEEETEPVEEKVVPKESDSLDVADEPVSEVGITDKADDSEAVEEAEVKKEQPRQEAEVKKELRKKKEKKKEKKKKADKKESEDEYAGMTEEEIRVAERKKLHEEIAEANRRSVMEIERQLDDAIQEHTNKLGQLSAHLDTHVDENGLHDLDFDHQAFLGDEAEQFKSLTEDESKARLAKIVDKIDADNDTKISLVELTQWIKSTAERGVQTRSDTFWKRSNPYNRTELPWDEYRAIQYGFLTDGHMTNPEGRWQGEDDVDKETLEAYKKLEARDRKRWTVADRDKNLHLSKDEFLGFVHPEAEPHMIDIMIMETMEDLDEDGDGKINLAEYVHHLYGDTKDVADWDSGGLQFRGYRDTNKDGFIDKNELKAWIMPAGYDMHQVEAEHLIYEADNDKDKQLTKEEIVMHHNIFVASQATNFGDELHSVRHDEL